MQKKEPKIFIIILNWNGKNDTLECLDSVRKIEYENYEIVVVDNGSEDDSVQAIRSKFKDVIIIENGANLGFAEGNNVGIEYALLHEADYVFLLNNDAVVDPGVIRNLLQASKDHPDAGIFGAKIYYYHEPNKIWYAGTSWIPKTARFTHLGFNQIDDQSSWREVEETAYACGCALLIKTDAIRKIGMLEPKYFLTWEESDWCYRARSAGFKCLFVPQAVVWHKVSSSFAGGGKGFLYQYFMERNRLLWIERNLAFIEAFKIYCKVISKEICLNFCGYISPNSSKQWRLKCKVSLTALRDYIFRKFGDCPSWIRSTK